MTIFRVSCAVVLLALSASACSDGNSSAQEEFCAEAQVFQDSNANMFDDTIESIEERDQLFIRWREFLATGVGRVPEELDDAYDLYLEAIAQIHDVWDKFGYDLERITNEATQEDLAFLINEQNQMTVNEVVDWLQSECGIVAVDPTDTAA